MKTQKKYADLENQKVYSFHDIDQSLTYSYSHYLNWLFDDRVELIKGKIFPMSAPLRLHQEVSGAIFLAIGNHLIDQPCKVYSAPFDVRFPKISSADQNVFTVLQPDICVVCDQNKLDDRGCIGAPDLVIEVLSPGNHKKELFNKYKVYEEFGVKEYWVANPTEKTILQYQLAPTAKFKLVKLFYVHEEISSVVLHNLSLKVNAIFAA